MCDWGGANSFDVGTGSTGNMHSQKNQLRLGRMLLSAHVHANVCLNDAPSQLLHPLLCVQVSLVALNLLADPLDSLHLTGGEEVGVSGTLPSHVTHYVNRNGNKDVSY